LDDEEWVSMKRRGEDKRGDCILGLGRIEHTY